MKRPALKETWRHCAWRKVQSNKTLRSMFRRLPYDWRRWVVRVCHLNVGMPPALVSEILERKVLFIHVPKTGGVSVEQALFGHTISAHRFFWQYEMVFSRSQLASFFKFAFVRNPWDRLVSAWIYLRDGGSNDKDRAFFSRNLAQFPDFESFVLHWLVRVDLARSYVHFVPQVKFIRNTRGRLEMDFIGRFEHLARDFEEVARVLGCSAPLDCLNRTRSRESSSYREHYTPRSADVVARLYRDDIETFGYTF